MLDVLPRVQLDHSEDASEVAGVLRCPECGEKYLHSQDVVIRNRNTEDGAGTEVIVTTENVALEPVQMAPGDPGFKGRRQDIGIDFTCENCGKTVVLCFVQHKGQTLVYWT